MSIVLARPERDESRVFAVRTPFFEAHPILTFVFTASAVNVAVAHGLGRVPAGYMVVGRSANVTVYDGSDPSTESELVLRSSGAATVQVVAL
jgi:hypothetical protein